MSGKRKPITFEINDRGCHICTSHAIGTHGYPCVWKDGRNQNLHRVLYEEENGPLPGDILVRHDCDERRCINLGHLRPGTNAENTSDITERERHNPPIGERSGTAKLTLSQVGKIRASTEPQSEIAIQYGIRQSTVSRIKSGKRWNEATAS